MPLLLNKYSNLRYRPDIDGLRALAVVAVILFHAGFETFSGGFIGVDVFFVISGYLITSIILQDLEQRIFTLANFYEKRARRILPALYSVMFCCSIFAWQWLLPQDMKSFSQSMAAVSVFSSNVLFWITSGYFDTASELKPLLHTWSLSVEEQYYVLFPLFLLLTWKFLKKALGFLFVALTFTSLLLANYLTSIRPMASFFLLPSRAWEMMIGALVAIYCTELNISRQKRIHLEAGSLIGFSLIVCSVLLYNRQTPSPGFYTLAPVLGTALVIATTRKDTAIYRLLSFKPFVGVGLISYSAYLWHQPIFSFARHRSLEEPSRILLGTLSVVSFVLAYFSWKYIERPFRRRDLFSRRQIVLFGAIASIAFLTLGLFGHATHGFINRERYKDARIINAISVLSERSSGENFCQKASIHSNLGPLVCVIGDKKSIPSGVLWGDSFAGALMHGLDRELSSRARSFYVVSSDGCIPIVGTSRVLRTDFNCTKDRHAKFVREALNNSQLKYIVWIGAFADITGITKTDYLINGKPANAINARQSIIDTLRRLQANNKNVFFVSDTPRFRYHTANYMIKSVLFNDTDKDTGVQLVSRTATIASQNELELLSEASKYSKIINALDIFCTQQCSSVDSKGSLLFIDGVHLSYRGSDLLASALVHAMF